MFSKASTYAINALTYISAETAAGRRASLKAIARHIDSPEAFTAKILQQLSKNNIIHSTVGAYGGFEMKEQAAKATHLSAVIALFDGTDIYKGCALSFKNCNEKHPCLLHDHYASIRKEIAAMIEQTSIYELSTKAIQKKAFLRQ